MNKILAKRENLIYKLNERIIKINESYVSKKDKHFSFQKFNSRVEIRYDFIK
jgi:hypothetical protein